MIRKGILPLLSMLPKSLILFLLSAILFNAAFAQLPAWERKLDSLRNAGNPYQLAAYMYAYGTELREQSDLVHARKIFQELKSISTQTSNPRMQGMANLLLGRISSFIGQEDSTLYYCLEALNIAEKNRFDSIATAACICISICYRFAEQYPAAYSILEKGMVFANRSRTPLLPYRVQSEKALVHSWEEQYEKAIEMQLQILPQIMSSGDNYWITVTHMNLTYCYHMLDDLTSRTKWLDLFMEDIEKRPMPDYLLSNIILVAGITHYNADNFKEAEIYLDRCVVLASKLGLNRHLQRAYSALSRVDSATGQFSKALHHFKLSQHHKEIVAGEKIRHNMKELEVKYQTAQKDKELAENRLKLRNREKWIGYGIIIFVLGTVITFILHRHNKQKQLLQEKNLLNLKKENELHVLNAAMQGEERERKRLANDLHDGVAGMLAAAKMHFSSVRQSVQPLQQSAEFQQAFHLLDDASDALRRTAHNLAPDTLTIYGLIDALRIYCNNVSSNNSLSVSLSTLSAIPPFSAPFELNLYRIIQELITNTIKHANATELVVQFSIHEDVLSVTVEDDGQGFHAAATLPGLGIANVRRRAHLMQGIFELNSAPGRGTSVYMEFPIINILL